MTDPTRDALCGLEIAAQVCRVVRAAPLSLLTMRVRVGQLLETELLPLIPTQESAARAQFVSVFDAGPRSV